MIEHYRWYILADNQLSTPADFTDEYGDTYNLTDYYSEYDAIKGLEEYLTWDNPSRENEFTLIKVYNK